MRQHRQRAVGFEVSEAAVNDRIGVRVVWIDAESLRQPRTIRRLDRGEAERRAASRVATKRTQREQKMQTPS